MVHNRVEVGLNEAFPVFQPSVVKRFAVRWLER